VDVVNEALIGVDATHRCWLPAWSWRAPGHQPHLEPRGFRAVATDLLEFAERQHVRGRKADVVDCECLANLPRQWIAARELRARRGRFVFRSTAA
jgi:hypothetical protein